MPTNQTVLECQNVSKIFQDGAYQVEVLNNINFSVHPSETVAILGPSGSGKSTLLHILGGLQAPTQGTVKIEDHDISIMPEHEKSRIRNRYLGFIYQFHHLLKEFTAVENVMMPYLISGQPFPIAKEHAHHILTKIGLHHRAQQKVSKLSGGERQRVAIARAIVNNPSCVLADEPTGNLDKKNASLVYDLLLELKQSFRSALIVVTHDVAFAKSVDKVYQIDKGQLTCVS